MSRGRPRGAGPRVLGVLGVLRGLRSSGASAGKRGERGAGRAGGPSSSSEDRPRSVLLGRSSSSSSPPQRLLLRGSARPRPPPTRRCGWVRLGARLLGRLRLLQPPRAAETDTSETDTSPDTSLTSLAASPRRDTSTSLAADTSATSAPLDLWPPDRLLASQPPDERRIRRST